jgi:hypothetical protein
MSEMIDLVAKAVDEELSRLGVGLKKKTQTAVARAAIAAMREATDDMLERGATAYNAPPGWEHETILDAGVCWRAMIDAALA